MKKLILEKLPYGKKDLDPVMSEDTIKYHRDSLAAGYVKRYNNEEGDLEFNEAGAFLHNIFFPQLKPPRGANKPHGAIKNLIEEKFDTYNNFKEEFKKIAMSIQGSGWVYLDKKGNIKTIKNHKKVANIVLLVDWWEHAWALDYQSDKSKYLDNIWKIINWDIVNSRLNISKEGFMKKEIIKLANHLDRIGLIKEADFIDNLLKKAFRDDFGGDGKNFAEMIITYLKEKGFDTVGDSHKNDFGMLYLDNVESVELQYVYEKEDDYQGFSDITLRVFVNLSDADLLLKLSVSGDVDGDELQKDLPGGFYPTLRTVRYKDTAMGGIHNYETYFNTIKLLNTYHELFEKVEVEDIFSGPHELDPDIWTKMSEQV